MAMKNGQKKRIRIDGTNLLTDEEGIIEIEALRNKYVGKAHPQDLPLLSKEINRVYETLRIKGRLWRFDGTPVSG